MTLMACGHGNGLVSEEAKGGPVCVVCGCRDKAPEPDLEGRVARCSCGKEVESKKGLPFFTYKPDLEKDGFYCGCRGWD